VQAVKALYERRFPAPAGCRLSQRLLEGEEEASVVRLIAESRPDLPVRRHQLSAKGAVSRRYQAEMKVPFAMGVGGSFDIAVGKIKRAPLWMQQYSWSGFRFLQEPRRMFKRYFIEDTYVVWLLLKEWVGRLTRLP